MTSQVGDELLSKLQGNHLYGINYSEAYVIILILYSQEINCGSKLSAVQ